MGRFILTNVGYPIDTMQICFLTGHMILLHQGPLHFIQKMQILIFFHLLKARMEASLIFV